MTKRPGNSDSHASDWRPMTGVAVDGWESARPGVVYLVGAGPGDPGLMTERAVALIASADAILHDRLIPKSAFAAARPNALTEYAGKGPRGDSKLQPEIERRMIELAVAGKSVVRLKGGDPFVFGRGGEEAAALAAEGIEFEIVPGVTAGVAASAYAGIPVTHRDHAAAVAFVTGHEDPTKTESAIDWAAFAVFPGTLVFYMGVKNLAQIAQKLIAAGRSPAEPVAVIAQGTTAAQHTVSAPLNEIADVAARAEIHPPALTVIGDVVAERDRIQWFERRPLLGRSIVVTRARAQASRLAQQLASLGADVIEAPAIEVHHRQDLAVEDAISSAGDHDMIAFTSANGVDSFFAALKRAGRDSRAIGGCQVAAIGNGTAQALARHGIVADFMPARAIAESMLELLEEQPLKGKRILLAVAANARPLLADGLCARGAFVDKVDFYDTRALALAKDEIDEILGAEIVTFASGSAVRSMIAAIGDADALVDRQLVSIGPITSAALREHGLEPTIEATSHDLDGLVAAVLKSVSLLA